MILPSWVGMPLPSSLERGEIGWLVGISVVSVSIELFQLVKVPSPLKADFSPHSYLGHGRVFGEERRYRERRQAEGSDGRVNIAPRHACYVGDIEHATQ